MRYFRVGNGSEAQRKSGTFRLPIAVRRSLLSVAVFLVVSPPLARPLDSSPDVSQYAHKAWKVSEGFLSGSTHTIGQTPDGYLWIGTDFGLYRFDGVRSVPWQPGRNASLPSNAIRKLFVSGDGTLWIGTERGLARWKDGKLTLYPELPAVRVDAFAEDGEGTVWVGLEDIPVWLLCAIHKGSVQCFGDNGSLGLGMGALLSVREGGLWAGTGTGLWQWRPGSPKSISLSGANSEIHGMVEDGHGAVLVSTRGGLVRVVDGSAAPYPLPGYGQPSNPFSLLEDRDGSLWIGTADRGLLHVHHGRTDHFDKSNGLSSNLVNALFQDREGNVWVGTSGGFDRFREVAVSTIPESQGFSVSSVESVLPAADGSVWLGTRSGLDRWRDGHLTLYRKRRADLPATVLEVVDPDLPDDYQSSLFEDHRGRIWTFSRMGASYLDEHGRFRRVPDAPGGFTHSIAEDSYGDLWISQDRGLFHLQSGGKVQQIPWAELGGRDVAMALASDPSGGGLWLGLSQGEVVQFKDGQVRQRYIAAEGLGKWRINKLQVDRDGTLWAATEGGLSRLKSGRADTLSSNNGLPCDSVHDFVEDNAKFIWLHTGCGLVRIARSSLDAWIGDPKRAVEVTVFGNDAGLTPIAVPSGLWPRMGKATDGTIWFVAGDGVGYINPLHLPFNRLPPPVNIQHVIADGKIYEAMPGLRLPALVHDLAIDYTALSLADPEKVRFRYRLEGQDKSWREVVDDREVQYSNLAPGNYRFRVTASNNSGIWNDEGASLDFVIPPAWFQTNWFRALCLAAFLTLLWSAHLYRVRQMQREEKKFREAVESMPACAFIAEPDGFRSFLNKRWLDYTGMRLELALGLGWQVVEHPDDLNRVHDNWRTALAAEEPFEYEERLRRGDGKFRWFLTRVAPVRDRRGKILKWCGVASDIEDRKRAEEASHRLNRKLRAISDFDQFLLRATNEQSLLDAVCRVVCEQAGYPLAWVDYAEDDPVKSVRPVAWAGVDDGYLASAQIIGANTEHGPRYLRRLNPDWAKRLRARLRHRPPSRTMARESFAARVSLQPLGAAQGRKRRGLRIVHGLLLGNQRLQRGGDRAAGGVGRRPGLRDNGAARTRRAQAGSRMRLSSSTSP
jgi:PAS domain S-box-containing protein